MCVCTQIFMHPLDIIPTVTKFLKQIKAVQTKINPSIQQR